MPTQCTRRPRCRSDGGDRNRREAVTVGLGPIGLREDDLAGDLGKVTWTAIRLRLPHARGCRCGKRCCSPHRRKGPREGVLDGDLGTVLYTAIQAEIPLRPVQASDCGVEI